MSITTCSIPATLLAAISTSILSHLAKTPGTLISPETQNLGAHLTSQGTHQLEDSLMSGNLQSSLSRLSNHKQYDNFEKGKGYPAVAEARTEVPSNPLWGFCRTTSGSGYIDCTFQGHLVHLCMIIITGPPSAQFWLTPFSYKQQSAVFTKDFN
jgi:hypothetical protein